MNSTTTDEGLSLAGFATPLHSSSKSIVEKEQRTVNGKDQEDEEIMENDQSEAKSEEGDLGYSSTTLMMIDSISENTMSILISYLNLYEALQMKQTCRHFHDIVDPYRYCSFSNESECSGECRMKKIGCGAPINFGNDDDDDEEDFFANTRFVPYTPNCHYMHSRDATILEKVKTEVEEDTTNNNDNSTTDTTSDGGRNKEVILALLANPTSFRCNAMNKIFKNAIRSNNREILELFLKDERCVVNKETLELALRKGSMVVALRLLLEPQVLAGAVPCKYCNIETGAYQCSFQCDGICPHDPQDRFCRGCAKGSCCQQCDHYQCRECNTIRDDLFLYECDSCHKNTCVRSSGDADMPPDTYCSYHCSGCGLIQCFDCIEMKLPQKIMPQKSKWQRCHECKKRDCSCDCSPAQECYECGRFDMLTMYCPKCQNEPCTICAAHSYEAVGGEEEGEDEEKDEENESFFTHMR